FRLGLFDPASMVPYAQTPATVLEHADHKAHALKMAQQSIVLLKNEGGTLPLSKNIKKIVVLGPNADNAIAVLGNYNGTPSSIITCLQGIKNKLGAGTQVVYEKAVNFTNDTLLQYADMSNNYSWEGKKGFQVEYFNNRELEGSPIARNIIPNADQYWQEGEIVMDTMKAYHFSARYTTDFTADKTGDISFELDADDGYRFLVDGKEVINAWSRNRWGARTYKLHTEKGKTYRLVLEYYQGEGKAGVHLRAGHFVKTDFKALLTRLKDADAIVYVGGISPQLEGEEMRVDYPGFNGGDRTSILLPAVQTELMKTLVDAKLPLVFVMMTGSAIATPWEAEYVPAIINAWYGGQSAGTAIADVLFGDYNPSGRLPLTFYAGDQDLPDFNSYDMAGRTYRYFKGKPLYEFGHGLSYTQYQYDQLEVLPRQGEKGSYEVRVKLSNTGEMDGEEVVQLYVSQFSNKTGLLRSLRGFQRVLLKAGEIKTVNFILSPTDLSIMDDKGQAQLLKGNVQISVGGAQPGEKAKKQNTVVEKTIRL
ncbi:MAG: glycoside hydrolase family 3 C-terminal domain-containing protein, partial [Flavisolibacter sp.]